MLNMKTMHLQLPTADLLINPVSLTPEEFRNQHGQHLGLAVTWHDKRVLSQESQPLTFTQWLLPWTRPKLTKDEKWLLRQLD